MNVLNEQFIPRAKVVFERHVFHQLVLHSNETVDHCVCRYTKITHRLAGKHFTLNTITNIVVGVKSHCIYVSAIVVYNNLRSNKFNLILVKSYLVNHTSLISLFV